MIAVVVASTATLGMTHNGHALNSLGKFVSALTPFFGHRDAIIFFGLFRSAITLRHLIWRQHTHGGDTD